MFRTPKGVFTLFVIAAGLVSVSDAASAHNGHPTSTTIQFNDVPSGTGDNFSGTVTASPLGCRKNRNVKVYRGDAGGGSLVGGTTTDSTGAWSVPSEDPLSTPPATDAFWARVTKKVISGHVCKPHTSAAINGFTDN